MIWLFYFLLYTYMQVMASLIHVCNLTTKMSQCTFSDMLSCCSLGLLSSVLVVIASALHTNFMGYIYNVYCVSLMSNYLFKAEEEKESEEAAKEENQEEDGDKSKPVASQLIPGTSWCVVWTGDEKMFFFNPTTRLSIWEKPDELENNEKVDEIVNKGPPKKQPSTEISM